MEKTSVCCPPHCVLYRLTFLSWQSGLFSILVAMAELSANSLLRGGDGITFLSRHDTGLSWIWSELSGVCTVNTPRSGCACARGRVTHSRHRLLTAVSSCTRFLACALGPGLHLACQAVCSLGAHVSQSSLPRGHVVRGTQIPLASVVYTFVCLFFVSSVSQVYTALCVSSHSESLAIFFRGNTFFTFQYVSL